MGFLKEGYLPVDFTFDSSWNVIRPSFNSLDSSIKVRNEMKVVAGPKVVKN